MRYENYKIEDMTFTNKEDWTDEEKMEVLATFPETKDVEQVVDLCNKIKDDIKSGILKVNTYGDINKISAKSYVKKNPKCFYGCVYRYSSDDLYIMFDGKKVAIDSVFSLNRVIEKSKDNDSRFNRLKDSYSKKEQQAEKERERDNYKEAHKERIDANLKARALLDAVKIEIPTGLETRTYSEKYYPTIRRYDNLGSWSNELSHTDYGELTKDKVVISEQTANELSAMVQELSKEISDIIDIYNGKYKDILRKNA